MPCGLPELAHDGAGPPAGPDEFLAQGYPSLAGSIH